jgi:4,5-dihydroxyphthalate decarboxylase
VADLKLSFACGLYDRMLPLYTGEVAVADVDLDFVVVENPREIFDRMAGAQEFDAAEMSASEFISQMGAGDCPFVALPVFPSRMFRHGFICVNRNGGIGQPGDLEGKRIGVPLYTQTAAIWARGLLENDYGVDLSTIDWVQGAVMGAGAHGSPSASPMRRPPGCLEINDGDRSLAELLVEGEIDAILGTFVDEAVRSHPELVRLFPDYRTVERDYFQSTGIFPMMHLVVIRDDVYEANPWIAERLFDAFEAARDWARAELRASNAQRYMLPWLLDDLDEIDAVFSGDAWDYGLEPNRAAVETLVRYMHQQGFIEDEIPVDDLFVGVGG